VLVFGQRSRDRDLGRVVSLLSQHKGIRISAQGVIDGHSLRSGRRRLHVSGTVAIYVTSRLGGEVQGAPAGIQCRWVCRREEDGSCDLWSILARVACVGARVDRVAVFRGVPGVTMVKHLPHTRAICAKP